MDAALLHAVVAVVEVLRAANNALLAVAAHGVGLAVLVGEHRAQPTLLDQRVHARLQVLRVAGEVLQGFHQRRPRRSVDGSSWCIRRACPCRGRGRCRNRGCGCRRVRARHS
jgi:hypothetical protein